MHLCTANIMISVSQTRSYFLKLSRSSHLYSVIECSSIFFKACVTFTMRSCDERSHASILYILHFVDRHLADKRRNTWASGPLVVTPESRKTCTKFNLDTPTWHHHALTVNEWPADALWGIDRHCLYRCLEELVSPKKVKDLIMFPYLECRSYFAKLGLCDNHPFHFPYHQRHRKNKVHVYNTPTSSHLTPWPV